MIFDGNDEGVVRFVVAPVQVDLRPRNDTVGNDVQRHTENREKQGKRIKDCRLDRIQPARMIQSESKPTHDQNDRQANRV
jgi:hypothetical protein